MRSGAGFGSFFPTAVGLFAWLKISDGLHHAPAQVPPIIALVLSSASTVNWVQMALFALMCALVLAGGRLGVLPGWDCHRIRSLGIGFLGGLCVSFWIRNKIECHWKIRPTTGIFHCGAGLA